MTDRNLPDPYAGNILVAGLGSIPAPGDALRHLSYQPPAVGSVATIPTHIRLHYLMGVRDLHIPSLVERQLLQSVDLMVRQSYKLRDPILATTWANISGESRNTGLVLPQAYAAAVEGISGVGKTQACQRSLMHFPRQTIWHESFPQMAGPTYQVVWLSVEVPPSGKSADLARTLMESWDQATSGKRFEHWLAKEKIVDGMTALNEWRQVATGHFLGVLHLDEIQNLFKLSTLKQRTGRKGSSEAPELAIVEDQLLRWLLYLTNSGQITLLVSGTPDGIGALTKRLSTLERLNTAGYHAFEPFSAAMDASFRKAFLPILAKYQYVAKPIPVDDQLAQLIIELTGGIHRIIIALWIAAHRVAFERSADDLRLEDFNKAAFTWLAPLAPAVAALQSKNETQMGRYEDLVRRDTLFWRKFWNGASLL